MYEPPASHTFCGKTDASEIWSEPVSNYINILTSVPINDDVLCEVGTNEYTFTPNNNATYLTDTSTLRFYELRDDLAPILVDPIKHRMILEIDYSEYYKSPSI